MQHEGTSPHSSNSSSIPNSTPNSTPSSAANSAGRANPRLNATLASAGGANPASPHTNPATPSASGDAFGGGGFGAPSAGSVNAPHGAVGTGSSSGVLSGTNKATSLQNYHMLAFRKALHPEFFGIEGRRRLQHGEYETEGWIFRGGHNVRFQLNGFCMSEVLVEHIDQIPDRGLIAALPCAGERDFEERVAENLVYMTTMQTETLSDHLYLGTYKEMMQHARENDSLFTAWTDAAGKPNLSLVDLQHFRNEVHIQGYHLRSDCGLVLRTQSMVQIVTPKPKRDGGVSAKASGRGQAKDAGRDSGKSGGGDSSRSRRARD